MKRRLSPKVKISTLVLIIVIMFFSFSIYHGLVDWTTPKMEDIKITANSTQKEVIAEQLIVEYLSRYKGIMVPQQEKLKDFSIEEIEGVKEKSGGKFRFIVTYSVKPAAKHQSNWIAGNGVTGQKGWINKKVAYVYVNKEGNTYSIEDMGGRGLKNNFTYYH